jgi:type IV secretory pathway TraG/TraD family ATPase VirD4
MSVEHRHSHGPTAPTSLSLWIALIAVAALMAFQAAVHAAALLAGWRQPAWNPLLVALHALRGRHPLPPSTPVLFGVIAALEALLALGVWRLGRGLARDLSHPDRAVALLADRRHIQPLTEQPTRQTARRLGVEGAVGLPVGVAVATGQIIYADFEAVQIVIAGPRRMKTSGTAIPTLRAAPGAAFSTSNKPDCYAATRLAREQTGTVWTLDPEQIASQPAAWWWNPLSYVSSDRTAAELCGAFVDAYRHPDARDDAFFEPKGQQLVQNLLRAAALDGRALTDCYLWSTRPEDDTPAIILTEHGLTLQAASVMAEVHAPGDQRGGIYGTAERILKFLQDPDIACWCCPQGRVDRRPELDLSRFVRSTDTLYLLSREGRGTSAGLVTALVMALCDAAERYAATCPGGRLAVPMVGVLDEAANICRLAQLPSLYSHYGSRGIPLVTILQSWSQGVEVWGQAGMNKLWSASTMKIMGGGVDEDAFLGSLEKLIGDYTRITSSPSLSHNGSGPSTSSTSWQTTQSPIYTIADLRALPRDRAIAFPAGIPPILIRPLYWFQDKQHRAEIQASIDRYDPAAVAEHTAADARSSASINPWTGTNVAG